jgi:hypothetical protein
VCVPRLLEAKRKVIREVVDEEVHTVHMKHIILQRQYFVARCLSFIVGNVFGLHSVCIHFPSTRKIVR